MRCWLRVLLCFLGASAFGISVWAQPTTQPTPAFANAYYFTEKDSLTALNSELYVGPSGKRYFLPHRGMDYTILGNNWVGRLPKLNNQIWAARAWETNDTTAWLAGPRRIALLHHDTLRSLWDVPGAQDYHQFYQDGIVFWKNQHSPQDPLTVFLFSDQAFHTVSWPQKPVAEAVNFSIDSAGRLYLMQITSDSVGLLPLRGLLQPAGPSATIACPRGYYLHDIIAPGRYILRNRNGQALMYHGRHEEKLPGSGKFVFWRPQTALFSDGTNGLTFYTYSARPDSFSLPIDLGNAQPLWSPATGGYYLLSGNRTARVFPWLRNYPRLFQGVSSTDVFALRQDSSGRIWAGSYGGQVALLDTLGQILPVSTGPRICNGSLPIGKDSMLLIQEAGGDGLFIYNARGFSKNLTPGVTGFYLLQSKDGQWIYYGTHYYRGLWRARWSAVRSGNPQWEKVGPDRGLSLVNILTISEDTLGRIWCGHNKDGIAVYDPATEKAKTFSLDRGQSRFGAIASLTDRWGAVWFGSTAQGLWYYADYSKPLTPQSCQRVMHPLLGDATSITAMAVWQDYLVLACYDRMLLLDLKAFHEQNRIELRYLNPQESNFSSFTEQNTLFVSRTDSTVWFATSDKVYQWDIRRWLAQPTWPVRASLVLRSGGQPDQYLGPDDCQLRPGINSFDIQVRLQSPDGLPRLMRCALVRQGDSTIWSAPGLQTKFSYPNQTAGSYSFLIEIFETDGTVARHEYTVLLRPFLWQQWWFWPLVGVAVLWFVVFYLVQEQRRRLAVQAARTKAAELETIRAERDKQLADLRVVTLSNQFRPHFILNALNAIGGHMYGQPRMESVISRLGESIGLIFRQAQDQRVAHPFQDEWKLVMAVIEIHRQIYIQDLETTLPSDNALKQLDSLQVPLGLLQIHVENALLHGLHNREDGPYKLEISVEEEAGNFYFKIIDNGVGRRVAAGMTNFRSHGSGTKNLQRTIDILNTRNVAPIFIYYSDDIFTEPQSGKTYGTAVAIAIPKGYRYD